MPRFTTAVQLNESAYLLEMIVSASIIVGETPFMPTRELSDAIRGAIRERRPFSFIRVGDGEAFVLGMGSTTSKQEIEEILNMWFGTNKISDDQVSDIRAKLTSAIVDCDVLGVSNQTNGPERQRRVAITVSNLGLWDGIKPICSAEEHMHLHEHHEFSRILSRLDFVGIITPRDIAKQMQAHWDIGRVERIDLPEEYHYAKWKDSVGRHYPDRFDEIMATLKVPYRGAVFLVGAGVLGKIYCQRIKELGGIAIDIGSTFDCWAQKNSRGNVKRMRLGF